MEGHDPSIASNHAGTSHHIHDVRGSDGSTDDHWGVLDNFWIKLVVEGVEYTGMRGVSQIYSGVLDNYILYAYS